ncbi:hypothetical protein GCM10027027_18590 [Neomicrococcus lactis]
MIRVTASLAIGTARADDLLRILSRDGSAPPPDEIYRRMDYTQQTIQESRHRLAPAIFHGRCGQIYPALP